MIHVIGTERRAKIRQPVQYLNNISHGQNLSSTSGEPEFVAQELFEIPASGFTVSHLSLYFNESILGRMNCTQVETTIQQGHNPIL
jgi:hypothetical protein